MPVLTGQPPPGCSPMRADSTTSLSSARPRPKMPLAYKASAASTTSASATVRSRRSLRRRFNALGG